MAEDTEGGAGRRLQSVKPTAEVAEQIAMDERVVDDDELNGLLEKRLRAADDKREVAKVYKAADVAAKDKIALLALEVGQAARVGRFRITKTATEPRHVEFD
ncbi:MAG: hypothetical protein L0227_05425, partial [Chloroflexi bacterium]|nr:hypothetical protein [Chloroflexota bacterium]